MSRQGLRTLLTLLTVLSLSAACGSNEAISPESTYFEGLDKSVVSEVLEHPAARQKIEEQPEKSRESLAQGIVRNFIVCRDALRAYQDWMSTGAPSELSPLPVPDEPREPSHSDWDRTFAHLEGIVDSGEPEKLQSWLTGDGSCGEWIPASPDSPSGPTIEDVVEGRA